MIISIDPGPTHSGVVLYDGERVHVALPAESNEVLLARLQRQASLCPHFDLVVEMITRYPNMTDANGKPVVVGQSVFETVFWIGRFIQAWPGPSARLFRREVTAHLCGGARRSGDPEIRKKLIDRFTTPDQPAIGKKASPGPLFGVTSHAWAALALAVTFADTRGIHPRSPIVAEP